MIVYLPSRDPDVEIAAVPFTMFGVVAAVDSIALRIRGFKPAGYTTETIAGGIRDTGRLYMREICRDCREGGST